MLETLRRVGLAGTKWARAQSWTIRLKLLKISAQVRVTTRKVWLSFSESYPYAALLRTALEFIVDKKNTEMLLKSRLSCR